MGLFNATLVMVSYLFISFLGLSRQRKLFYIGTGKHARSHY